MQVSKEIAILGKQWKVAWHTLPGLLEGVIEKDIVLRFRKNLYFSTVLLRVP